MHQSTDANPVGYLQTYHDPQESKLSNNLERQHNEFGDHETVDRYSKTKC